MRDSHLPAERTNRRLLHHVDGAVLAHAAVPAAEDHAVRLVRKTNRADRVLRLLLARRLYLVARRSRFVGVVARGHLHLR